MRAIRSFALGPLRAASRVAAVAALLSFGACGTSPQPAGGCHDDNVAHDCPMEGCLDYDHQLAMELSNPSCHSVITFACGAYRVIAASSGYFSAARYYDASGKLIAVSLEGSGPIYCDDVSLGMTYGPPLSCSEGAASDNLCPRPSFDLGVD
jgi:hypothetical protein